MAAEFTVSGADIDEIVAWTVIRAARELARMLAHQLEPLNLSPVEFGVIAQLAVANGLSQAELARSVGVRPQSMTALVAGLEDRALIDRGPERGRGRHSSIRLTSEGRALLALAYPAVRGSNDWFGGDPGAIDAVQAVLRPMLGATTDRVGGVP